MQTLEKDRINEIIVDSIRKIRELNDHKSEGSGELTRFKYLAIKV